MLETPFHIFKGITLLWCIWSHNCLTSVNFYSVLCIQLKLQLSECQSQLDVAQKEAQAYKEELAQVTLLTELPPGTNIYIFIQPCNWGGIRTCFLWDVTCQGICENYSHMTDKVRCQWRVTGGHSWRGGYVTSDGFLFQVREQLGEITMGVQREQNGPAEAQPSQVRVQRSPFTSCQRVLDTD